MTQRMYSGPITPWANRSFAKAMLFPSPITHMPYLSARFSMVMTAAGSVMPQFVPRQWRHSCSMAFPISPA